MEATLTNAYQAYQTGDLEVALKILQHLNERNWGQPELLLRMAQVYLKLGRHVDAQGWFQEVSRLDPDGLGPTAREGIVHCLLMGDQKRGSSSWDRTPFLLRCAEEYAAHGKQEDALRCWFRVLSLKPEHEEARQRVGSSAPPDGYGWVG